MAAASPLPPPLSTPDVNMFQVLFEYLLTLLPSLWLQILHITSSRKNMYTFAESHALTLVSAFTIWFIIKIGRRALPSKAELMYEWKIAQVDATKPNAAIEKFKRTATLRLEVLPTDVLNSSAAAAFLSTAEEVTSTSAFASASAASASVPSPPSSSSFSFSSLPVTALDLPSKLHRATIWVFRLLVSSNVGEILSQVITEYSNADMRNFVLGFLFLFGATLMQGAVTTAIKTQLQREVFSPIDSLWRRAVVDFAVMKAEENLTTTSNFTVESFVKTSPDGSTFALDAFQPLKYHLLQNLTRLSSALLPLAPLSSSSSINTSSSSSSFTLNPLQKDMWDIYAVILAVWDIAMWIIVYQALQIIATAISEYFLQSALGGRQRRLRQFVRRLLLQDKRFHDQHKALLNGELVGAAEAVDDLLLKDLPNFITRLNNIIPAIFVLDHKLVIFMLGTNLLIWIPYVIRYHIPMGKFKISKDFRRKQLTNTLSEALDNIELVQMTASEEDSVQRMQKDSARMESLSRIVTFLENVGSLSVKISDQLISYLQLTFAIYLVSRHLPIAMIASASSSSEAAVAAAAAIAVPAINNMFWTHRLTSEKFISAYGLYAKLMEVYAKAEKFAILRFRTPALDVLLLKNDHQYMDASSHPSVGGRRGDEGDEISTGSASTSAASLYKRLLMNDPRGRQRGNDLNGPSSLGRSSPSFSRTATFEIYPLPRGASLTSDQSNASSSDVDSERNISNGSADATTTTEEEGCYAYTKCIQVPTRASSTPFTATISPSTGGAYKSSADKSSNIDHIVSTLAPSTLFQSSSSMPSLPSTMRTTTYAIVDRTHQLPVLRERSSENDNNENQNDDGVGMGPNEVTTMHSNSTPSKYQSKTLENDHHLYVTLQIASTPHKEQSDMNHQHLYPFKTTVFPPTQAMRKKLVGEVRFSNVWFTYSPPEDIVVALQEQLKAANNKQTSNSTTETSSGSISLMKNVSKAVKFSTTSSSTNTKSNDLEAKKTYKSTTITSSITTTGNNIPVATAKSQQHECLTLIPPTPHNYALRDLSFFIPAGSRVLLCGKNGSGKSTLGKVLARLYKPTAGSISIDNHDFSSYDARSYRKRIGYVEQHPTFFSISIKDNLLVGFPTTSSHDDGQNSKHSARSSSSATAPPSPPPSSRADKVNRQNSSTSTSPTAYCPSMEDIERACKNAEIHNDIMTTLGGYSAVLAMRGMYLLSSSQKARLALARALVRDPSLLILDEVTSSFDPPTERAILKTIQRISETSPSHEPLSLSSSLVPEVTDTANNRSGGKGVVDNSNNNTQRSSSSTNSCTNSSANTTNNRGGRTTFIISHTPAAAEIVDIVLMIEKGVIVEAGKHSELMAVREGRYRAFWGDYYHHQYHLPHQYSATESKESTVAAAAADDDDDAKKKPKKKNEEGVGARSSRRGGSNVLSAEPTSSSSSSSAASLHLLPLPIKQMKRIITRVEEEDEGEDNEDGDDIKEKKKAQVRKRKGPNMEEEQQKKTTGSRRKSLKG